MKKFTKRVIPMLVAMAMSFSLSAVTSFAAETTNNAVSSTSDCDVTLSTNDGETPRSGAETWYYTGYIEQHVGDFTMTGSNMTPTKTIDNNNLCKYLTISASYSCSYSSKLKVEIVDANSGFVYASATSAAGTSGYIAVANSSSYNMKGKQVKIRFILYDANGNYTPYRNCYVDYGYTLRAISE